MPIYCHVNTCIALRQAFNISHLVIGQQNMATENNAHKPCIPMHYYVYPCITITIISEG